MLELRHFLRAARGGAVAVVVVFALLSLVAVHGGLLGLPLGLILFSWFWKYVFILFDATVRGVDEPPALDIQMLNPLDEQRPLAFWVIVFVAMLGLHFLERSVPHAVSWTLAAVLLTLAPASMAVLALEGNPLKAVNPVLLLRLMARLGPSYAVIWAVIALYAGLLFTLHRLAVWEILESALTLFAILSVSSGLAGAMYERRHELGLDTWHSPERSAERERKADLARSEAQVTEAYGLARVGRHDRATALLEAWLEAQGRHAEDYRWLLDHVASWTDSRYAHRVAQRYVDKLLEVRRGGEALDAVVERLRIDPGFRPQSAHSTLAIARLAAHGGGHRRVARLMVTEFGVRFPGDPRVPEAAELARELGN